MYATIRGKHIKTKLANSPLQPAVQTVLCTFQPPGARRPAQIRKWSLIMGGGGGVTKKEERASEVLPQ